MSLTAIRSFLKEARRRRVYVVAVAYIAISAGIIQVIGPISETLMLPHWTSRLVIFLLILGLPVVLLLAWIFDVTSEGVKRTPALDAAAREARKKEAGRHSPPSAIGAGAPIPELPVRTRRLRGSARGSTDVAPPDPLRVKRVALGHMRHELRTPINGILGYSEMVLEEADDPVLTPDLHRIREAGRRLLSLVDEILDPEGLNSEGTRELEDFGERIRADLRTPINAVIGYSEMVMEAASENGREELLPDLERIRTAGRQLLETSEDIVRAAVLSMGGQEGAEKTLDESSRLAREVLGKLRPLADGGGARRIEGEGRVLVVDDNAMNRDLLSRSLAHAGYMVAEAGDGAAALSLLEEQSFDVVLLDVIMPGMDGVEALGRIRGEERLRELPVVMLSSLDELDSVIRCLELGAEEYLVKPVPAPVLEARIAANVELRRMREVGRGYQERIRADERFIESLLSGGFPSRFAGRVRAGEVEVEESYPEVTALCCAFGKGAFDSTGVRPVYHRVEALAGEHGVELSLWRPGRFLAMAGAPGEEPGHPGRMAELALALARELGRSVPEVSCRVGLHTGPAAAGILGRSRFRFEMWGEALELAEKMARQAPMSGIAVTPASHGELREAFAFETRGIVEVAGRGQMRMYLLSGRAEA